MAPTRSTTGTTAAADALIPGSHPFSSHLARAARAEQVDPHRAWTPEDGPMPAIYLSHGAPVLFEMPGWMTELLGWARALPRPQLARQVAALMPDAEPAHEQTSRGLDHGAWVPLKIMYPEADVPVLQLSMPTHDPQRLMALGRRLRVLREQGVLVVGSGYMTHGLPYLDWSRPDQVPGWSSDFDGWAADALARGDVDSLAAFRDRAPGMPYAHPTVEHFTPLFVTLGAATDPTAPPATTIDGYAIGLARRSFQAE